MKKPQLSDFDISETSLSEYDAQQKKYLAMLGKVENERIKWNKIVITLCICLFLGLFITGCVFWAKSNNEEAGYTAPTIVLLFLSFAICPLLGYLFHWGIFSLTKFEKWKEEKLLSRLPFRTDKAYYIDPKLEEKIEQYNRELEKYKGHITKSSRDFWINLNPYEFEREVAMLFERLGCYARVTRGSGDGGVDIVLVKNNKKVAVQCKHHATPVGPSYIRELIGVTASQGYSACIFVSLNGYTKAAENEAKQSRVTIELLSLTDLLKLNEG